MYRSPLVALSGYVATQSYSATHEPAAPPRENRPAGTPQGALDALDTLRACYERALPWTAFAAAGAHRETCYAARPRQHCWHVLIVADPSWRDRSATLARIAHVAERSPSLDIELRAMTLAEGRDLLRSHDVTGRGNAPLILVLDEEFREIAAWVERPAVLEDIAPARNATRLLAATLSPRARAARARVRDLFAVLSPAAA